MAKMGVNRKLQSECIRRERISLTLDGLEVEGEREIVPENVAHGTSCMECECCALGCLMLDAGSVLVCFVTLYVRVLTVVERSDSIRYRYKIHYVALILGRSLLFELELH